MAKNVTWMDIEWFPGKCLTKKVVKCNPNKRLISAKPMIRTVDCESFFSFFKLPSFGELLYHMQEDYDDYEIGSVIRDKIIPSAVLWFTGEAEEDDSIYMQFDDDDDDYDYDYDYDDDDNDDADDDDDDEDEYAEDYDGEEQEEEKHKKKIQVQHQDPVVRGNGMAAAAATGGASTSADLGGVANQFKPMSLYIRDLDINVTDIQLYQLFNQAG